MPKRPRQKLSAKLKRQRSARLFKTMSKAYRFRKAGNDRASNLVLVEDFIKFGGVYVKFLQGVLLGSGLMAGIPAETRLKVFEKLEPENIDVVKFLQYHLPSGAMERFETIAREPFAAGSFGQVYRAKLTNGKEVIVKILRPGIKQTLNFDLKILGAFAKATQSWFSKNMDINYNDAIGEFRRATVGETDYITEANFAHELYEHYKDHKYIVIPYTYLELSTSDIIVQDYIDGISGSELLERKEQGQDPYQVVKEMYGSDLEKQIIEFGFESFYGIFTLPRIQGDPHPGNMRFMTDNRVGVIDFGVFARSPKDKAALLGLLDEYSKIYDGDFDISEMYGQFMRFFVSDLYKSLKKLTTFKGMSSDDDFTKIVGQLAGKAFEDEIGQDEEAIKRMTADGSILNVINKSMNKKNRFGLVMQLESSDILRAVRTYMGVIRTLDDGSHNLLPQIITRTVNAVKALPHGEGVTDTDSSHSLDRSIQTISSWLERIAERDPNLFRQLSAKLAGGKSEKEVMKIAEEALKTSKTEEKVVE
jgi:serine/threonine protein kinase